MKRYSVQGNLGIDFDSFMDEAVELTFQFFGRRHLTLVLDLDTSMKDMKGWKAHFSEFTLPQYVKRAKRGFAVEVLKEIEAERRFYRERSESIMSDDGYRTNSVNFGAGNQIANELCLCIFRADVYDAIKLLIEKEDSGNDTIDLESGFEAFLSDRGKELLPFIRQKFKDARPARVAQLLFALNDLQCLEVEMPAVGFQEILHSALAKTLGNIGGRTGLNEAINRYNRPTEKQSDEIEQVKKVLKGCFR